MGSAATTSLNSSDHVTKSLLLLQHRDSHHLRGGGEGGAQHNNNNNNNSNSSGINNGPMGISTNGMKSSSSVLSSKVNGESVTLTVMRGEDNGASRGQ